MVSTAFGLQGKTAVVVGASTGIGRATAHRLAGAGAWVVVAGISEEGGSSVAKDVGGIFCRCDVSDSDNVKHLMQVAAERTGRIDIVVNNAGIALPTVPIEETTYEHFDQHIAVNVHGVLNGMRHAVPYMVSGGAIVNTASIAGIIGLAEYGSYGASKFAVVGLTKIAAIEFGPRGIRVNCVCPTTVDTPMIWNIPNGAEEAAVLSGASTLGRIIDADHVAAAIHFLVADDCPVISGQAILIDCGITSGISTGVWEALRPSRD